MAASGSSVVISKEAKENEQTSKINSLTILDEETAIFEKRMAESLALILETLAKQNPLLPDPINRTRFHGLSVPSVSIEDYLLRYMKWGGVEYTHLIMALIYIDRFIVAQDVPRTIDPFMLHRLIATALRVATKVHADKHFNNAYHARLTGVSVDEMNEMEIDLVFSLHFDLFIDIEMFNDYFLEVLKYANELKAFQRDYYFNKFKARESDMFIDFGKIKELPAVEKTPKLLLGPKKNSEVLKVSAGSMFPLQRLPALGLNPLCRRSASKINLGG